MINITAGADLVMVVRSSNLDYFYFVFDWHFGKENGYVDWMLFSFLYFNFLFMVCMMDNYLMHNICFLGVNAKY